MPSCIGSIESYKPRYELTVFARSLLLLTCCFLFNSACWIVSGILFGRNKSTRNILSLCLLAWVIFQTLVQISFRHLPLSITDYRSQTWLVIMSYNVKIIMTLLFSLWTLQASTQTTSGFFQFAIDNATRNLINLNQLPVTCGLYFSLGHSTIVIVVNVAIAISSDVYKKLGGVGNVGNIVGSAVSASFLFLIGFANSIILWRILRQRRRIAKQQRAGVSQGLTESRHETPGLMMRILGPVTTFVNQPWKMYPVGVLFGFGFDTASSVALLAVTALARKGESGQSIAKGDIVILPFLFTAGMSLVDSADSILMLYSYAGFTDKDKWALIHRRARVSPSVGENHVEEQCIRPDHETVNKEGATLPGSHNGVWDTEPVSHLQPVEVSQRHLEDTPTSSPGDSKPIQDAVEVPNVELSAQERANQTKLNTMSNLSIILTLISILVALSISLIVVMGLLAEQCGPCQEAAQAGNGGGLAGSWWRAWAKANDDSGFIGAAIVGGFCVIVAGWYMIAWVLRRWKGPAGHRSET